jgi:ribosomal protein L29
MKQEEIKKMKDENIASAITEKRVALRTAKFGAIGSRAKNVKAISGMRKDVARLMTELRSRRK